MDYELFSNPNLFLTEIRKLENLMYINEGAFYNCKSLKYVELGSKVEYIGDKVFNGCENINDIFVYKSNKHFIGKEGVLYRRDNNTLVVEPQAK